MHEVQAWLLLPGWALLQVPASKGPVCHRLHLGHSHDVVSHQQVRSKVVSLNSNADVCLIF
eukprot:scaffold133130_cov49-Prasinocladus_malaysianus.AAC.2